MGLYIKFSVHSVLAQYYKINFKGRQIFRFFGQMVERYDKQKILRLEQRYLRPRWEAVA